MVSRRALLLTSGAFGFSALPQLVDATAGAPNFLRAQAAADLQLLPPIATRDALELAGSDLRLQAGTPSRIVLQNALDEPVSLQWRGRRGAGALDAAETRLLTGLPAGEARTVDMVLPDGGTTLLRAAPSRANLAARGLQTVVALNDVAASLTDHDLPILLADRLFAADGGPRFGTVPPADAQAAVLTVNGRPAPFEMDGRPRSRVRLRLVNGSVRRVMLVAFEGARPLVVAIDGQPSELFAPARDTLPIGPGARYDVLLDMPESAGSDVRLVLKATERLRATLEAERTLVRLRAVGFPQPARPPIGPLPANPALPIAIPLEAARRTELVIAGLPGTPATAPRAWTVNGVGGEAATRPVIVGRRGEPVVLGFANRSSMLVPLRIAGHAVRLLHGKDDGWAPYWRDTLLLPPGSRNHVAFMADAPGRWVIDSGFDDLTLAGLSCFFDIMPG